MTQTRWKIDTVSHRTAADQEPTGAPAWGNPCEIRECLRAAVRFWRGREVCEIHDAVLREGRVAQ